MVWVIVGGFLWALGLACGAAPLDIGIFQRFGENLEQATVQAVGEQPLTVVTSEQRQFQTRRLKIQTTRVPLTTPMPWSRVMVSAHRSFEDAQGVARTLAHLNPAIVRPQRWQVWVMRQATPPTPAQAQLVTQLQQNYPTARVESGLQTEEVVLDLNQQYRARQVTIQAPNNRVKFGTRLYGGNLRLMPNSYGTYSVINRVDLQTYLRGVVPYEIAPVAPYQAIKAQAVVARTFALRNLKRFSFDGYDLCATANCQVYKGLSGVTALTDKAVASTQGQVLTYQGELVDALYTSANGGTSARYSDLWLGRERPYLQAKPESLRPPNLGRLDQEANLKRLLGYRQDFNESGSPAFRWVRTYSSAKLVASLQENLPTLGLALPDLTTVTGLKVAERSTSGRVLRLAVQTNRGELTLSKDMILSAINQLPSTLFYVESAGDKGFRLVGGGWGHGLGLSQYGSYGLAKRGWDYQRILGFYFPQTNLSRWAS